MSKTKILIQLSLALIFALTAGYLTLQWMASVTDKDQKATAEIQTVGVVVASQIIPPGTRVTPEMVRVAQYLPDARPEAAYANTDEVVGRVTLSPLAVNEPLTASRLTTDEIAVGGVSVLVNPGKRAMSVRGNKVMGLAGFIRPGNKVDVIVTLDDEEDGKKSETKIVLENVPVIASGTQLEPGKDGKEPSPVDVYTLEVTPEESERLALAATKGTLHFALRNFTDGETVLTTGQNTKKTLMAYRKASAQKAQRRAASTYRVKVITGATVKTVKLK